MNEEIHIHTTKTDGEITSLRERHEKHSEQFRSQCSREVSTLLSQKSELQAELQRQRDDLASQR